MSWKDYSRRSLWQHPIWGGFQKSAGRKVELMKVEGAEALVIEHKIPMGFSWLEVPRGPLFQNPEALEQLMKKIRDHGKKAGALFVQMSSFDPEFQRLTAHSSKLTVQSSHPEASLVIDLDQSEEEILKQMKPKGRYNIKVAQKHGVQVGETEVVDDFYEILATTGSRDGFGIHPKSYYQKMLDSMTKNAQLLVAVHERKVIAGGLFVYLDEWGIYYYGASSNEHRNLMAPYLIQWEAIKEAKRRGCKYYDFLGIAPEGAKNHAWKGVTQFKKKFGGRVVSYPQAREIILRPFWYRLYKLYKKIR